MKLNLRQAIKLVAELREELKREQDRISNEFSAPLRVDGKDVVNEDVKRKAEDSYERSIDLAMDLILLRTSISKANEENGLTMNSIILQELRKLNRIIDNQILSTQYNSGTQVVSGVGVVETGIVCREKLEETLESGRKQMKRIQDEMDKANNNIEIEVDLETV